MWSCGDYSPDLSEFILRNNNCTGEFSNNYSSNGNYSFKFSGNSWDYFRIVVNNIDSSKSAFIASADTQSENSINLSLDVIFTDTTRKNSSVDATGTTTSSLTVTNDFTKIINYIEFRLSLKKTGNFYTDNISIT